MFVQSGILEVFFSSGARWLWDVTGDDARRSSFVVHYILLAGEYKPHFEPMCAHLARSCEFETKGPLNVTRCALWDAT